MEIESGEKLGPQVGFFFERSVGGKPGGVMINPPILPPDPEVTFYCYSIVLLGWILLILLFIWYSMLLFKITILITSHLPYLSLSSQYLFECIQV
jgi:hypothetical protein